MLNRSMHRFSTSAMTAVMAFAASACSSSGSGNDSGTPSGPDASQPVAEDGATTDAPGPLSADGGQSAPDADAGATARLTWKFVALTQALGGGNADAADAGAAPPMGGVQVCVAGMPAIACATSGADGTFTLAGLPTGTQLRITGKKNGYRSALLPVVASAPIDVDLSANPVALLSASSPDPSIGVAIDWANEGQILFFLLGPSAAGGTSGYGDPGSSVALSPPSGIGFKYLNKDNTFSSGTAFTDVLGLAFNVAPAEYLANITSHDTCGPIPNPEAWGYASTTPNAVGLPVLAGYVTYAGAFCLGGPDAGSSDAGTADAARTSDAGNLDGGTEN